MIDVSVSLLCFVNILLKQTATHYILSSFRGATSLSFSDSALSHFSFNISTYFVLYLLLSFRRLSKILLHRDVTIPSLSNDLNAAMSGSPREPYVILRELRGHWALIRKKILPLKVLLLLLTRESSSLFCSI